MSSTACDRTIRLVTFTALLSAAAASACAGAGGKSPDRPSAALGPRGGLASGMSDSSEEEKADREAAEKGKKEEEIRLAGTRGVLELHEIQAGLAPHQSALLACFQDRFK